MREIESEIEKKAIEMVVKRLDQIKASMIEGNFHEVFHNMSILFLSLLVSMALVAEKENPEQYLKSSLSMLFLDGVDMIRNDNRRRVYVMNGEVMS